MRTRIWIVGIALLAGAALFGLRGASSQRSAATRYLDPKAHLSVWVEAAYIRDSVNHPPLPQLLGGLKDAFVGGDAKKWSAGCAAELYAKVQALAFSMRSPTSSDEWVLVLQLSDPKISAMACLAAHGVEVVEGERTSPFRELKLATAGELTVTQQGAFILAGPTARVAEALERKGRQAMSVPDESIALVRLEATELGVKESQVALARHDSMTHVSSETQAVDKASAIHVEALIQAFATDAKASLTSARGTSGRRFPWASPGSPELDPEFKKGLQKALEGSQTTRDGLVVHASAEIDTTTFFRLGILYAAAAAQEYILQAKVTEAKVNIGRILKAVVAYQATDSASGLASPAITRFPPSGAQVPAVVPSGIRVTPQLAEWDGPGWRDLGFALDEPLYFALELVVAADGKSLVVHARGDLDGDGIQSDISRGARIIGDGANAELAIDPSFTEVLPDE